MDYKKPAYEDWARWVDVVTERLSEAIHVYNKPPYPDAYLLEQETQAKMQKLISLVRELNKLVEGNETLGDMSPAKRAALDDETIAGFVPLIEDVLALLPEISADMQYLMKSPWSEDCTGKLASVFFCGPQHKLEEGVGSGHVEHGRLPEALSCLLEAETVGDERPPRKEESSAMLSGGDVRRVLLTKRRRVGSMGSAGRVD